MVTLTPSPSGMSTASHDGGVAASALGIMDDKAFAGPVQSNTAEHKSAQSNPPMTATGSKQPKGSVHFIAGGIGGMCGAIVTSPLDVVKTRLQSDMYRDQRPSTQSARIASASRPTHRGWRTDVKRLAYHFVETGHLLRDIAIREGPRALFRGLGPTLVGVIPARSINFYTYGNGKLFIAEHLNGGRESSAVHLLAAACAGVVTATATNPIWVVKTRLQLQQHEAQKAETAQRQKTLGLHSNGSSSASRHSAQRVSTAAGAGSTAPFSTQARLRTRSTLDRIMGTSRPFFRSQPPPPRPSVNSLHMTLHILRSEGILGLYKGMSASYLGVAEGTIQWALYEQLKRVAARRTQQAVEAGREQSRGQQWLSTVGSAGTAKMVASLLTYPHEVLRTRLRQEPLPGEARKYTGLVQTMKVVLREEGLASFYGGLSAHLLRVVPNAAIMFVVYETMLNVGKKGD